VWRRPLTLQRGYRAVGAMTRIVNFVSVVGNSGSIPQNVFSRSRSDRLTPFQPGRGFIVGGPISFLRTLPQRTASPVSHHVGASALSTGKDSPYDLNMPSKRARIKSSKLRSKDDKITYSTF